MYTSFTFLLSFQKFNLRGNYWKFKKKKFLNQIIHGHSHSTAINKNITGNAS